MRLSTSSSKGAIDQRVLMAAGAFVVLTLAYGFVSRKIDKAPRDETWFWANKLSWHADKDIVFAGDSRVNRGVSPLDIKESFPDARVGNFAFSGQGYTEDYLKYIPSLIDPNSKYKLIVLGVSPRSLTKTAQSGGDFENYHSKKANELWMLDKLSAPNFFLTSENPVMLLGRAVSKSAPVYHQWHTPEGWQPGTRDPLDPSSSVSEYKELFKKSKVDPVNSKRLVKYVGEWVKAGYRVALFRPPIAQPVRDVEDTLSGFDETALRGEMEGVGAVWLDSPPSGYITFDGNHLDKPAAEKFSKLLGQILKISIPSLP